jgi:hypothetical protein
MKNTLTIAALLLAATSAQAEWMKYDDRPEAVYYADIETLQVNGNSVSILTLMDFKKPLYGGTRSMTNLFELDCASATHRMRNVDLRMHSESMGGGEMLADHGSGSWITPQLGSPPYVVHKAFCHVAHKLREMAKNQQGACQDFCV